LTRCSQRYRALFLVAPCGAPVPRSERSTPSNAKMKCAYIPFCRITSERRLQLSHHFLKPVQPVARPTQQIVAQTQIFHPENHDRSIVHSNHISRPEVLPRYAYTHLHFHCASGFATQILAHMLDSLVRVSRRVNENHFVSTLKAPPLRTRPVRRFAARTALLVRAARTAGTGRGGPKAAP